MAYDSTMAFADHEGFRCGTCHPFEPFDLDQNRTIALREYPLVVMDATFRHYRDLSPDNAGKSIHRLAERCEQVEGIFTMLWHNTSLDGDWAPWARMYASVLQAWSNHRKNGPWA